MRETLIIRFLYKTVIGRLFLKILVNPKISKIAVIFLSSKASRIFIPGFIKRNSIDMERYKIPKGGYKSFNDFFTRRLKEELSRERNVDIVSPCDGLLTVSEIDENSLFQIKNTVYSLKELLKDERLADVYTNGTAYVFRLTPTHFHRYIWAASGCITENKHIDGVLHSVRPICHEKVKVFIQNTREYNRITIPSIGEVLQMEIGALLVGKIHNHQIQIGDVVSAGCEKGYFEYGGSSIVVLTSTRKGLSKDLINRQKIGNEIPVHIGEKLVQ